jgi:tetratricopeptide (TPR) repeat protein
MTETQLYSLDQAHQHFAKTLNGLVWELMEKPDRSTAESELMLYAAYASAFHWLKAGTGLQHQRAEWLITRVLIQLGQVDSALRHASRCLDLTHEFAGLMYDFDLAYAYEALARANALAGHRGEALKYLQLAEGRGETIANEEDKRIFLADLNGGQWYGMR